MKNIEYKRTWCDYLTPCPHQQNVEVGSFECSKCTCHISLHENTKKFDPCDYARYSYITTGYVTCKHT